MTDTTKLPASRPSLPGAALLLLTSAAGTYANPVSKDFADACADPSIMKAKEGYSDEMSEPPRAGEGRAHFFIPMVPALQV
jgi:hypothetical protein